MSIIKYNLPEISSGDNTEQGTIITEISATPIVREDLMLAVERLRDMRVNHPVVAESDPVYRTIYNYGYSVDDNWIISLNPINND